MPPPQPPQNNPFQYNPNLPPPSYVSQDAAYPPPAYNYGYTWLNGNNTDFHYRTWTMWILWVWYSRYESSFKKINNHLISLCKIYIHQLLFQSFSWDIAGHRRNVIVINRLTNVIFTDVYSLFQNGIIYNFVHNFTKTILIICVFFCVYFEFDKYKILYSIIYYTFFWHFTRMWKIFSRRNISLKEPHNTSLTLPLFIESLYQDRRVSGHE